MGLYFDPVSLGFFDDALSVPVPATAVSISKTLHALLLAEIGTGRILTADANGQPITTLPPPPSAAEALARLRRERDRLLAACDFTQVADAPLSPAKKQAWADYRQQLRDLPESITDPADIAWPEPPTGADA